MGSLRRILTCDAASFDFESARFKPASSALLDELIPMLARRIRFMINTEPNTNIRSRDVSLSLNLFNISKVIKRFLIITVLLFNVLRLIVTKDSFHIQKKKKFAVVIDNSINKFDI